MENINKIKKLSIWIFIVPFVAINLCLLLITHFHGLFLSRADIIHPVFPYFDGGASISRTARPYPSWLIFKPAMVLTGILLIYYWSLTAKLFGKINELIILEKYFKFFGILSGICLITHTIFGYSQKTLFLRYEY